MMVGLMRELWGKRQQIASGLNYLKQLGLQIWL